MNRSVLAYQSFIVFLLMLGISTFATAQVKFSGKIISSQDDSPIPYAEINLLDADITTTSDDEGKFLIEGLKSKTQRIAIFALSHRTILDTIDLRRDTSIVFVMKSFEANLSEVIIREEKLRDFKIRRLKAVEGTSIYAGKKTEVIQMELVNANLATNNPRQIYNQVVGLNIYEGNDAGIQLNVGGRGLDPNRTSNFNTRQNGYDISADLLGYPESYYTPNPEIIKEIQVVRGAASLQYGPQFGGLLNFVLKSPVKNRRIEWVSRQSIGTNGLYSNFNSFSGTINKFSYYQSFNYKQGQGFRPNSDFDSKQYFGVLRYDFSDNTSLNLEISYLDYLAQQAGGLTDNQFEADPLQSNRSRNWFAVNWKLASLELRHRFGPKSKMSVNLFGLDASRNAIGFRGNSNQLNENPILALDEQNQDGEYIIPRDLLRSDFNNWGLEWRFINRYELGSKPAVLLLGAKYYQSNNFSLQGAGSTGIDADFTDYTESFPDYPNQSTFDFPNRNVSLFAEQIFYLNDHLSITPGIRFEYIKTESDGQYQNLVYDLAGNVIFSEVLPDQRSLSRQFALLGIGLSYKTKSQMEWYANVSQNYRSITFNDIRVVTPSFIIDPDIKDEEGFTFDAGAKGQFKDILSYDSNIFGLLYQDRIGIILDDRANRVRKNIGTALIVGAELFAELNILKCFKALNPNTKLSYFINASYSRSEYLSSEENNVVGKKVEFVPDINIKSGITAGYKNFIASFQFTYISDQFTDVENSLRAEEGSSREGILGEIPSYYVTDLSLSYSFSRFKIETGVNNLLNRNYFTRRATGYPGPGIIPSDRRNWYLTIQSKF